MIYHEGITINGKHSFNDFGIYIASRNIGIPAKKVIKATIPFMNGSYDFSAINGVPAYEERPITYSFDITGATVEEMEEEKAAVMAWLMSAQDVDIYDDAYPYTHFHGSYDSASWSEEDSQGNISVVFKVYPFRLANVESMLVFGAEEETKIALNDGFPVQVKINSPYGATVMFGGVNLAVGGGEYILPTLLPNGNSEITVKQVDGMTYDQGSKEENGISFVVNSSSGTVIVDGTATETTWLYLRSPKQGVLPVGEYWLDGCPKGGSSVAATYGMTVTVGKADGTTSYYRDAGDGVQFSIGEDVTSVYISIFIGAGYTASGLIFHPRLYGKVKLSWSEEVI